MPEQAKELASVAVSIFNGFAQMLDQDEELDEQVAKSAKLIPKKHQSRSNKGTKKAKGPTVMKTKTSSPKRRVNARKT
jgi:hypothetical protein